MKVIVAVIHPDALGAVQAAIDEPGAGVVSVSVAGEPGARGVYRGAAFDALWPRFRVEIVVPNDATAPSVLDAVARAASRPVEPPPPAAGLQRRYRARIVAFLAAVVLVLFALTTITRTIDTLRQLDLVEAERDRWQRPDDVLRALQVREGDTAADLGSGSGYFIDSSAHRWWMIVARRAEL